MLPGSIRTIHGLSFQIPKDLPFNERHEYETWNYISAADIATAELLVKFWILAVLEDEFNGHKDIKNYENIPR